MATITLKHGDVLEQLKGIPDNSIDAIVQDPPYNLSFMNTTWDTKGAPKQFQKWCESWAKECLRVLRPGGHLLSFGGTRTYHRMATGIEDAGLVIRDFITWHYGTGFPKSLSIGKQWDKHFEIEREVVSANPNHRPNSPKDNQKGDYNPNSEGNKLITKGESVWEGYGTALKPASEPIVVAQKTKEGTFINNVLKYGVGPLNIDACRIHTGELIPGGGNGQANHGGQFGGETKGVRPIVQPHNKGRWPANVILSHHPECKKEILCEDDCPIHELDEQSGDTSCTRIGNEAIMQKTTSNKLFGGAEQKEHGQGHHYRDKGGASRFFKNADWECEDDCPVHILDEQAPNVGNAYSGLRKSETTGGTGYTLTREHEVGESAGISDGLSGASKFFHISDWKCHDDCPIPLFPDSKGACGSMPQAKTTGYGRNLNKDGTYTYYGGPRIPFNSGDGSAARFFYCAKPSKSEKNCKGVVENKHPTVKPVSLMDWLIKLICPTAEAMGRQPVILDCFLGSGTTAIAAHRLGIDCIGIDADEDSLKTAYERLTNDHTLHEGLAPPHMKGWKPEK